MQGFELNAICDLGEGEIDFVDGGSMWTGYIALAGAGLAYGAAMAGGPVTLVALGAGIAVGALVS